MGTKDFHYYAGDTRNVGRMENPQIASCVKGCSGDSIEFNFTVKDDIFEEISFFVQGCKEMHACGAAIADSMSGKSVADGCALSADTVMELLPGSSLDLDHWSVLAVRSFGEALEQVLYKRYLNNRFS